MNLLLISQIISEICGKFVVNLKNYEFKQSYYYWKSDS